MLHESSLWARLPLLLGLSALIYLTYSILSPFLIPVAWAAILAFVTWPMRTRLLSLVGGRINLTAAIMTLFLAATLIGPLAWLLVVLQSELRTLYSLAAEFLARDTLPIPAFLQLHFPAIANELTRLWNVAHDDPAAMRSSLQSVLNLGFAQFGLVAGEIGRNLAKFMFTLFALFFFFRDGPAVLRQLRQALAHMTQRQGERYLLAAGNMTRAVVFGIVLTALGQGALAGIGYAVAGAPNPVFLTLITFVIALVPFGTPFAWGGVALWLFANGQTLEAAGLAMWGMFVVSWVDNIIRPLVISNATHISFLLVMFGVLGGLASFGMIGLFIGPVILAVVIAIWQEWLAQPVSPCPLNLSTTTGARPLAASTTGVGS